LRSVAALFALVLRRLASLLAPLFRRLTPVLTFFTSVDASFVGVGELFGRLLGVRVFTAILTGLSRGFAALLACGAGRRMPRGRG
jgi:hypothetical protein